METLSPERTEQQELINDLLQPQPTVIGIEGGPCGGKTTLQDYIHSMAGERPVYTLPEAASEHINALAERGINFGDLAQNNRPLFIDTEAKILRTIVDNIETAKQRYSGTPAIIVADRCDIGAYVRRDEHKGLLKSIGLTMPPMLSHVDQLHYLPSVARLNPALYDTLKSTNQARYESSSRAAVVCALNQAAVARHPEFHITYGGNFNESMAKLAKKILEPESERELKVQPTQQDSVQRFLADSEHLEESDIEQSYHESDNYTFRLRKTVTSLGETLLSFTVKTGVGVERQELQRILEPDEFDLLRECKQLGKLIMKQRTTILKEDPLESDQKRLWAVDRYYDRRLPEWNLETDVADEQEAQAVADNLPDFTPCRISAQYLTQLFADR